jgi:sodium-dependent dicarboxylate transporter 2/3/5
MIERFRRRSWSIGLIAAVAMLAVSFVSENPKPWRALAVLMVMGIWWISEAIPLGITALLPIAAFPVLGIANVSTVCREYAHPLIFLFLSGFLLADAMSTWGLDRRIAIRVVTWVGPRASRLVLGVMLATAFISLWVNNTASAAMMLPVGLALAARAAPVPAARDEPASVMHRHSPFATALMLGIAYAASIGGVGSLIGTAPNLILAAQVEKLTEFRLSFASWLPIGLPVASITLIATWWWITRWVAPPEFVELPGGQGALESERRALGAWTPALTRTAVIVVVTALLWTSREFWEPLLLGARGTLEDGAIGVAAVLIMFCCPSEETKQPTLLTIDALARVPWETLLLFGGGLALAKGMEDSGLSAALASSAQLLAGIPWPLFLLLVCALTVLLTEFASNTATAAMLLPLMPEVARGCGVPPEQLMIPVGLAASMGFMLPAGTPPNAMVYGTGLVPIRRMMRAGVAVDLISILVIALFTSLVLAR